MELLHIQHIVQTPGLRGGKPHIAGTRITVADIAFFHLKQGLSVDEIVATYDLAPGDVHAALSYYFDNRAAIDRQTAEDETYSEELARQSPSLLQERLNKQSRKL